nr:polysaccharide pyruvyl transferase family protein [Gemmiger formicilis]
MRVGLLTFHRAYNYGAVLQCYALNYTLNKLGYECKVIDYWPDYFKNNYYITKKFSFRHPPVKTWLRHIRVSRILKRRNKNFEKFIQNYILITEKTFETHEQLLNGKIPFDIFVTGSDQVWHNRCAEFDPVYFLALECFKSKPRFSYAASFGMQQVPTDLRDEYIKRLQGYRKYSVREKSGQVILKDLLNVNANVNCDPTLLLSREEWKKIEDQNMPISNPYVLVYYVKKTKRLQDKAYEFAKKHNCDVICVACNMEVSALRGQAEKKRGFIIKNDVAPSDFIQLVDNAKMVFTNSFHGTIFSLIFKKDCFLELKHLDGSFNNRVIELLESLSFQNIKGEDELELQSEKVDWNTVEKAWADLRDHALDYLKSMA